MNGKPTPGAGAVTRVIIVDDHCLIREALRNRLESKPHIVVVGEAGDAGTALAVAAETLPHLALIDIDLAGPINGIDLTVKLRARHPEIAVLILSMYDHENYVTQAVRAGARGYVLKAAATPQIVAAIEAVAAGGTYFSQDVMETATHGPRTPVLSRRERQVLDRLVAGDSNKQIANALHLSVRTVETHRLALRRKLNATSAGDLVTQAIKRGLVKL